MHWSPLHKARVLSAKLVTGLLLMGGLVGTALSVNAAQNLQLSIGVRILSAPNPVTGFSAAPVGSQNGDIQLAWIAPANSNNAAIHHYLVRFATYPALNAAAAEGWWTERAASQQEISPAHAPGSLEFTALSNFTVGVTYYFGIKAVDQDGMISPIDDRVGLINQAQSLPLYVPSTEPPLTPTNFVGIAAGTSNIQWTWDAAATAGFYTLNSFPAGTLITQTTNTFAFESGFTPNSLVSRTLRAGNGFGLSDPTAVQNVYTLAAAPINLRLTLVGFTEITTAWDAANNADGTQYRLERSLDGVSFLPVVTTASMTYANSGLTELTTYYYRVRAQNGDGLPTGYSNVVSTMTPLKVDFIPPSEPMGLNGLLDPTGRAFTLIWDPVERNADASPITDLAGYNIYRRDTLTGAPTKINTEPVLLTAFADRVDGQVKYYTIRAVDRSGNESADSLFADSSSDTNIIFLSTDQVTSVVMPQSVNEILRSSNNKYRQPLGVVMTENAVPANTNVVRNISLNLIRADTRLPVLDLAFSVPDTVVSVGYNVVNGQVAVGSPLQTAPAITNASPKDLSFYWNNGVTWVKVGGTLDEAAQSLRIKTSFLGDYQLRISAAATSLTLDQANVYPRVFTPNNDGYNDRVYFILENPNDSAVQAEIYDLDGRLVKILPQPSASRGIGTTLIWDGTDNNNAVVPSGAYIYRIKGEGQTFTGTVAVAR